MGGCRGWHHLISAQKIAIFKLRFSASGRVDVSTNSKNVQLCMPAASQLSMLELKQAQLQKAQLNPYQDLS